jgi:hypothetical protein
MSITASIVKERQILFSTPMIRAILEGRKTVTRRIIKPQPREVRIQGGDWLCDDGRILRPYALPGGHLWVREGFAWSGYEKSHDHVWYRADGERGGGINWRPSIHMPRWASRITLEVTGVRVERLQEISARDAVAEGIECPLMRLDDARLAEASRWAGGFDTGSCQLVRVLFRDLWDSINGPGSWESNPYVWVVSFRRVKP